MWVLIACFLTTLVAAVSFWYQTTANWKGDPEHLGGRPCKVRVFRNRRYPVGCRLGVDAPDDLDFTLRPETWFDRMAKAVGLASEFQIGDAAFDDAVYLLTDDERVATLLRQDPQARAAVGRLFHASGRGVRLTALRCVGGSLWAHYAAAGDDAQMDLRLQAAELVHALTYLADGLAKLEARGWRIRDVFAGRSAFVLGVGLALLINAGVQLFVLAVRHFPRLELWNAAVPMAAGVTLLVLTTSLAAIALWMGSSARRHVVLAHFLFLGGAGLAGSAYAALVDLDIDLDHSEATPAASHVDSKRISHGRRGSRSYYVTLTPWHDGADNTEVRVDSATFERVQPGDDAEVWTHEGALHWPWIEHVDYSPARPQPKPTRPR